jgi:sn-glycerol 3-phosphate transport system substrate-binding protein
MRNPSFVRRCTAPVLACAAVMLLVVPLGLGGATPAGASGSSLPPCPLSALSKAKGKVTITFWESMTRANAQTLQALTSTFNSMQNKVHVNLVPQASYDDTWNKYAAGLSNGHLPAMAQLEDVRTQLAVDTGSFLPVQSCMNASHYPTWDFLPRTLAYWKVGGVQEAMPFAVSNPVFYYNKKAFVKAGLNPVQPPATLPQLLAAATKLKAAGYQMGLKLDPWHLETWLASANQLFVNHRNGRAARTTAGVFNSPSARLIFTDLNTLVRGGYAVTNPSSGPDEFDNLLGIGSGKYAMTIDSSADLGTISQVLSSGQYANVSLGVGAFPVLGTAPGGIEPGGSALYISNRAPAAQQAAAWTYITYLDSTIGQAFWGAGTGYVPVRKSSTQSLTIRHLWATNPGYKVAYDQLLNGRNTAATAGSVIGPYAEVRVDVLNAEEDMFAGKVSPKQALSQALSAVNGTLSSYNQRLGG